MKNFKHSIKGSGKAILNTVRVNLAANSNFMKVSGGKVRNKVKGIS